MHIFFTLTLRQKFTFIAHLFKAIFRQHHSTLVPILKEYINEKSTVIDVGAHAGQFAKIFATLASEGHVYSFEPGDYAYSILTIMHKIKGLSNVSLVKMGAGSKNTKDILNVPIKASGSFGYGRSCVGDNVFEKAHRQEISMVTLDSFVKENKVSKVSFIKIDVEGNELSVLEGAINTIKRDTPAIMVEINRGHLLSLKKKPEDIFDFFKALGYTYKAIDETKGTLFDALSITDTDYIFYRR